MKTNKILTLIFLLLVIAFAAVYVNSIAYSNPETSLTNLSDTNQTSVYTCPMHPDVIMDKPGQCPKCGMDLVLKTDDSQKSKSMTCENMDNCNGKGCSKETCMGSSGGCSENCPMMKDHKNMDMNEHQDHDKMDHKNCKSDGNSGCMGH